MRTRWRDQRDQPLEKLAGLEYDVRRAVSPAALERVAETAIGLRCQPRGDGDVCVQADAVDHGAARASRLLEVVSGDAVTETRPAPAGAWLLELYAASIRHRTATGASETVPARFFYQSSSDAKISGATIVASDSIRNMGVFSSSLPQVIFSVGNAPLYEP